MSIKIMSKVWDIDLGNPIRKLVMLKLADNANDHGVCWPSMSKIADQCNCSVRSVGRHIDDMASEGIITIKKEVGRHNTYVIQTSVIESLVTESCVANDRESCLPMTESPQPMTEMPTNHKEPSLEPSNNHQGNIWPEFITKSEISEIKELKRKATKQKLTDRAQKLLCKELEALHSTGYTMEQVLNTWAEFPHWKTFKADYLIGKQAPAGQAKRIIEKREQTATEKTPEQKAKASEILGALRT